MTPTVYSPLVVILACPAYSTPTAPAYFHGLKNRSQYCGGRRNLGLLFIPNAYI